MKVSMSRPARARRAFTLIELLTVIAIIGILAAILIPTVGAVRSRAAQARVLSNLRQMGVGFRAYANDNKDRLPLANYNYGTGLIAPWDEVLLPYLGITRAADGTVAPNAESLFFHPRDPAAENALKARRSFAMPRNGALTVGANTYRPIGYTDAPGTMQRPDYQRGLKLGAIQSPSRVILLTERRDLGDSSFVGQGSFADINVSDLTNQIDTPEKASAINGNGTLDFLFADGHVKAMKLIDTVGNDEFPKGTVASPKGMWFVR